MIAFLPFDELRKACKLKINRVFLTLALFLLCVGNLLADATEQESTNPVTKESNDQVDSEIDDLDECGFDDLDEDDLDEDEDEDDLDEDDSADLNTSLQENEPADYNFSGYTSLLGAYNYAQKNQSVVAAGDLPMDFSGLSRA